MVWMIFTFLFRDWCCDSLPRPWGSTSGLCCVLANGQSSCEGSQAPHGSDRRFLRDECQSFSSHGVRGNLDLHLSLPIPSGLGVIGGVGSLSTGSPSGRGSGYLGLMYSQAPVRSYTKDRAGLQGDHTPKGGGYKVKNRNSSCGNLCRPHWTQVVAYHCLSVLCGGKGTAPGCAPRGSAKVPSDGRFGIGYTRLATALGNFEQGNIEAESAVVAQWLTSGLRVAMSRTGWHLLSPRLM